MEVEVIGIGYFVWRLGKWVCVCVLILREVGRWCWRD
jgi:hypothetical protein